MFNVHAMLCILYTYLFLVGHVYLYYLKQQQQRGYEKYLSKLFTGSMKIYYTILIYFITVN